MDMLQIFLDIGEIEQANNLFERLPEASRETEMGKALSGQLTFETLASKLDAIETLQSRIYANPDDYDGRFDLAIRQISIYQYEEAIGNLFYILKKVLDYKEGAAKEMLVAVANIISPVNIDLAQDKRRKLGNTLAE